MPVADHALLSSSMRGNRHAAAAPARGPWPHSLACEPLGRRRTSAVLDATTMHIVYSDLLSAQPRQARKRSGLTVYQAWYHRAVVAIFTVSFGSLASFHWTKVPLMRWYAAVIVMECRVGMRPAELWDEQVRLLRAADAQTAFIQAGQLGRSEEHHYSNIDGSSVRWKFVGLGDLHELLERRIRSGVEVFSSLARGTRPRVARKRDLSVFWSERNRQRTADEFLADELRSFAPR
jgi:hypothetical protein